MFFATFIFRLRDFLIAALKALLIWAATLAFIFCAVSAHSLEAQEVDLGLAGSYDGIVRLTRDSDGRMLFSDAEVTTPVTLLELRQPPLLGSHGLLADLLTDDHPQYLLHTELAAESQLETLLGDLNLWSSADSALHTSATLLVQRPLWITIPVGPFAPLREGDASTGWTADSHATAQIVNTVESAANMLFIPVVLQPGTVVNRLRIRWESQDSSEGIVYALNKRNDATTAEPYADSVIWGSLSGAGAVSVIDLTPETIAEGAAYFLTFSPTLNAPDGQLITIFSIALETTTRAY